MKKKPHQVSAWCSVGTAEEKQDAGFPGQRFAHPSAFGFHTYRDLIHCHEGRATLPPDFAKCGGSRREVESAAKMAAVPVRVWTLSRWWLSQSEFVGTFCFARDNFETNLRHL